MSNKLLLADDSVTIQKVVGIIFSNEDYELAVVDNGNAALEKARESHPDIMLVDALMPGINGYEVCQEIRRDPALKNTPLLLLTGAFEPFDEDKARQCGADDFISKPFDSQSLIESVKKLIALGRERAAVPGEQTPPVQVAAPASDWAVQELVELPPEPLAAAVSSATGAVAEPTPAAAEDDLWGAFELEAGGAEPVVETAGEESVVAGFEDLSADNAFSFAESESIPEPAAADFGSNWVPVGEQEFGCDEPSPVQPAPTLASVPLAAVSVDAMEPNSFPESSFTASVVEPSAFGGFEGGGEPVSAAIPMEPVEPLFAPEEEFVPAPAAMVSSTEPAAEPAAVSAIPAMVALDEGQLKALLASVSREVIEKIVWEVVPDLAETIIKEEIRKIKEGLGNQ
ncbi:response regulator [Geobacter argillaceus]|uniref:Response regulator receiver domain-containing protein n=1 Tax=Geobacter argillaceus TaxID=345631 RepID=A0A562WRG3_9BACT|nr:response regulator [Geobacter argillaceus]TWJ32792.1 response regulator receiver domain-containing protein [Geobacter argillaceus]